ncbi:DUF4870 domain-containing protein [Micromonospora yangpuensis]|nr:DUF4870 domain-containing protein [Micromonospora yangpuensis]
MTEPPRPPGSGDPDPQRSDPTAPMHPPADPFGYEPPTAPLSGTSGPGDYPPPGGYPPPEQPTSGGYPPPFPGTGGYPPPGGNPPPGNYPPPGGNPPPGVGYPTGGGYGGPPAGYPSSEEKNWALIAHFGGALGVVVGGGLLGWVAPLIAYSAKGQSPAVRAHAVAALNFQLTWVIALALSFVLAFVTCGVLFFVPMLVALVPLIFGIVAGVKAGEGVLYRYPMTSRFIK